MRSGSWRSYQAALLLVVVEVRRGVWVVGSMEMLMGLVGLVVDEVERRRGSLSIVGS